MVYNWPSENVDAIVVTDGRCARHVCSAYPTQIRSIAGGCSGFVLTLLSSATAGFWGLGISASTGWLFQLVGPVSRACWQMLLPGWPTYMLVRSPNASWCMPHLQANWICTWGRPASIPAVCCPASLTSGRTMRSCRTMSCTWVGTPAVIVAVQRTRPWLPVPNVVLLDAKQQGAVRAGLHQPRIKDQQLYFDMLDEVNRVYHHISGH